MLGGRDRLEQGMSEDRGAGGRGGQRRRAVEKTDQISKSLRRVYGDVASEPLPDDLLKLLEKLEGVDVPTRPKGASDE